MKTLIFLLLLPATLLAQKSDTIWPAGLDEPIVFTVGDIYKVQVEDANPFEAAKYKYIHVCGLVDGWIQYTYEDTLFDSRYGYEYANKRGKFYKWFLKDNDWEIVWNIKYD